MPNKGTYSKIARLCAVFALTLAILGGLAASPVSAKSIKHVTLTDTFQMELGGACPDELSYNVPTGNAAKKLAKNQLYSHATGEGVVENDVQFCVRPGTAAIIDAWGVAPLTDGVVVVMANYSDKDVLVTLDEVTSGEVVIHLGGYTQTAFEGKVFQVIGAGQSWMHILPDCGWKFSSEVAKMLTGSHAITQCIDQANDTADTGATVVPTGNGNGTDNGKIDSDATACTQGYTKDATRGVLQIPAGCSAVAYQFQDSETGAVFCNADVIKHACYTDNAPFQFQIVDGVRVPNEDEVPSGTPDFFSGA